MNSEDILKNLKTNFESFVDEIEKIYSNDTNTLDFVNNVKKEVLEDEKVNERLISNLMIALIHQKKFLHYL